MIKVEAKTLQEAYSKASEQLSCSVTDLTFEVIQHPSNGLFGLFKKNAIIVASCKHQVVTQSVEIVEEKITIIEQPIKKEQPHNYEPKEKKNHNIEKEHKKEEPKQEYKTPQVKIKEEQKDIFNNFYHHQKNDEDIIYEIRTDLEELFKYSCFDIKVINVAFYDAKTVLIEFDGNDSALLIGKEGYRYKALSYMIFNWVNAKYQLMIRLEIAEFLKNQEEMINNYLAPIIEKVKKDGNAKTKPLDGVLIHIALTKLREEFPNKYVGVKSNAGEDSKYIIINNFLSNNDR